MFIQGINHFTTT